MSSDNDFYPIGGNGGIPSDVMDSEVINNRNIKVSIQNLEQIAGMLLQAQAQISNSLEEISTQIKLLNARYESVHETSVGEEDIKCQ